MLSVSCDNPKATAFYRKSGLKEAGVVDGRLGRELVMEAEITGVVNDSHEKG